MNVLILGNNSINAVVEKNMKHEGIDTTVISDAAKIVKFKGQPGNYLITTPTGNYSVASVIITEPPQFEGLTVDGGVTINIMNDTETGKLLAGRLGTGEKIVLLLDYTEETPEYITARAIYLAKQLAEQKKEVLFLSKVVKSGYGDNELTYREARNAGVTFVKYEKLSLYYDEEADSFKVEANDGVFDLSIATPYLLSVTGKETPELKAISKKLRLYKPGGTINDDKFFLFPAFTTRRGIYYLNPALVMPNAQSAEQVILTIIEDIALVRTEGSTLQFPEVEPNKCAFCYSCYRACPHGAMEPDIEVSAMKVIESVCQACGICIAICPGEAITRKDSARQTVDDPAPVGELAGKGEPVPKVPLRQCKIYCCENGAAEAFEAILSSLGEYEQSIDCERVACGGRISTDMLTNDFRNYKTVIVACCIEDACRHMDGDKRACKQSLRAAELVQKAGLGNRRVEVIKASHAMSGVLKDNILGILEGQI